MVTRKRPCGWLAKCALVSLLGLLIAGAAHAQTFQQNQNFQSRQAPQTNFRQADPIAAGRVQSRVARPTPQQHVFGLYAGRYLVLTNSGDFPYSEDNVPDIFRGRGSLSFLEGFKLNLTYQMAPNLAIGYELTSQFKKIDSQRDDGTLYRESWFSSMNLAGLEYYFDPILFADTYGFKLYFGVADSFYVAEAFNSDGSLSANYEQVKIAGRTDVIMLGVFFDYGEDDFGFRAGTDYIFGENVVEDDVYNHQTGVFERKTYDYGRINIYAQIRYLF